MSDLSSPGPERPRSGRRSVRFTFTIMVAAPAACLVLLWGLALATVLRGRAAERGFSFRHGALGEVALFAGGGLLVVLISAILIGLFARRLSRDILSLESTARHLATEQLPQLVERLRRGDHSVTAETSQLRPAAKTSEVARAGAAIATLQQTAVAAAASEARLREAIGKVFVSLARRNQSLLQRQLRLIDSLEQKAASPAALADLFPLDHLTTRMRRHAEGLIILSGAAPGRSWSDPVPVIDVIRGAIAEVEDYKRVGVATRAQDAVTGSAVADMIHLLAELIENATLFSPSGTQVEVRAGRVANGFAVEVDDRGLGIPADQLTQVNQQLASPPGFDLANADRLGLFVVARLAARHSVRVSLRPSPYGGTTAIVLMPNSIVVPAPDPGTGRPPGGWEAASTPGLSRGGGQDALSLTGPGSGTGAPPVPGWAAPVRATAGGVVNTMAANGTGAGPERPVPGRPGIHDGERLDAAQPPPARPATVAGGPTAGDGIVPGSGVPGSVPAQDGGAATEGGPAGRTADSGTYRGLPRRVRQANLSPHLRAGPAARPGAVPAAGQASGRSPEEARSLVASLQNGWQRGRLPDETQDPQPTGGAHADRQPGDAPPGEEACWKSRGPPKLDGT